jgi:hypothetical protein
VSAGFGAVMGGVVLLGILWGSWETLGSFPGYITKPWNLRKVLKIPPLPEEKISIPHLFSY